MTNVLIHPYSQQLITIWKAACPQQAALVIKKYPKILSPSKQAYKLSLF